MFIRETSLDGKISYWTIRPESNRCITLDQVCKVSRSFTALADIGITPLVLLVHGENQKCATPSVSPPLSQRASLIFFLRLTTGPLWPLLHSLQTEADPATVPVSVQMLLLSQQVRYVFLPVPLSWGGLLCTQNETGPGGGGGDHWLSCCRRTAARENIFLAGGRDTSSRDTEDKWLRDLFSGSAV